ncbi:MAG: 8-amino-7-oxononanoate synthase, partial [Chromatiales bacterium]
MAAFDDLKTTLGALQKRQLYRHRRIVESAPGREIVVNGRTLLNFCSNDYLGLAAEQRVCAAFRAEVV